FLKATTYTKLGLEHSKLTFNEINGRKKTIPAHFVTQSKYISNIYNQVKAKFFIVALYSFFICIALCLMTAIVLFSKGKKHLKHDHLRGSKRVDNRELTKIVRRDNKKMGVKLAGLPVPFQHENRGFMLSGTTGSGKSTCMHEIMSQVRKRGNKAVIYDIEGDFVSSYYRQGKDFIANPLDERCIHWSQWLECDNLAHYEAITHSLMPDFMAGKDPFWLYSARILYATTAFQLREKGQHSIKNLTDILFSKDLKEIAKLVKGTAAETLASSDIEKTALCVKVTILTF